MATAGVVFRSPFLLVCAGLLAVLTIVSMRRRSSALSVGTGASVGFTALFLCLGLGLLGGIGYALSNTDAPLALRLSTVVGLFPAAFFLYIAYAGGYWTLHGRRSPSMSRVSAFMSRLTGILNTRVWGSR